MCQINQCVGLQVEKHLSEKREWLDRNLGALCNLPKTQDPPTTAQQICGERQVSRSHNRITA